MRIGVVSDTHGHGDYTRAAVDVLHQEDVDVVLHCGDIGGVEIPDLFAPWPDTHFVFGNVDRDERGLRDAIQAAGLHCHGRFAELRFAETRIAVVHGDDGIRFREAIRGGQFDLVCYGHTHVAESHSEDGVLVLNPGAIYRASPHSLAIVQLPELLVTTRTVPHGASDR